MTGVEWQVERVVRVVDGDSLRVIRSRLVDIDGQQYRATDADPAGVLVRLAWVDTPERGRDGWHEARHELLEWLDDASTGDLRVVVYASAGWDRLLVDLLDADGVSASQWLMTEGNGGQGWPAYEGGRA